MTAPFTPERWAYEITHLLNAVFGADRFPIDIPMIAQEYSADSGALRPAIPAWVSASGSDMDFGQIVVAAAAGIPRWTSASLALAG